VTIAPCLVDEEGARPPAHQERAAQIDVDDALPLFDAEIEGGRHLVGHTAA
jgi:hypothetical protein